MHFGQVRYEGTSFLKVLSLWALRDRALPGGPVRVVILPMRGERASALEDLHRVTILLVTTDRNPRVVDVLQVTVEAVLRRECFLTILMSAGKKDV